MEKKIILRKVADLKENPDNPKTIKGKEFENLVQSLRDFPQMLWLRPLVVDGSGVVLGGNSRLKALRKLKVREVPTLSAEELTEEERRRFVIADNVIWGNWNFDALANEWDMNKLVEWGMTFPDVTAAAQDLDKALAPGIGDETVEPEEQMKKITFKLSESDHAALVARLAELHEVKEVALMLLILAPKR